MLQDLPIQAASGSSLKLLQRAFWSFQAVLVLAAAPSLAQETEPILTPPRLSGLRPEGRNIVITWEGGAGPYQLYTRSTLSSPWVEVDAPTDGTSITAVKTEQMAFFRVSSGRGNSTDRKAPSTPAGLRATPLTCNEVSLSWSSASDTGTGVKGYMVYRDGVFLKTVLAPDTSTSDTSTDGNTSYSYSVRSYDFANNLSGLSSPLTATTPQCEDMIPPTTPINIVATAVTATQVDLRWQASSDSGGSGLAGYLVYEGTAYIGGSSTPSYSARGLAAGPDHCFTVIAYDGNGNSSQPSVVTCASTGTGGGPANDNFAGRLNLTAVAADANNLGATKEAGEPLHAGNNGGKSVWWTWTPPVSQDGVIISTAGSSFDTLLAVYKGSAVSGLVPVASNDDDPNGGVTSLVRFVPEVGATYAIAVDGKNGAAGSIRISVATCTMIVFPMDAGFDAMGGYGTINVGSMAGCAWTALSHAPWITLTSGASGGGNGVVGYAVDSNTSSQPRSGYVTVGGSMFAVAQQGVPCGNTLSSYSASYGATGGDGSVNVNASAPDCAWSSVSDSSWLTVLSGASGTGSRNVSFRVAANTGVGSRTGTVTIAGQRFTVTQGGAACSYALSSNGASFPYSGGGSSVNILAPIGCNWSVASDQGWLVVTSASSGSGNSTVTFTVTANGTTVERSGTLTIGGQSFRVTQAAGCSFAVSPLATNVPAAAGAATVSVAAGAGCSWTAVSQSPWITVTAGANGAANGTVTFSFGANPGSSARGGSLLVAGKTLSVTQAGTPCNYTLSQPSGSFSSAASSGSVDVFAAFDCNWNAVPSGGGWITITSGGSGPGNGTIRFSLTANTSATSRNGSISVGGRSYAITQGVETTAPPAPTGLNALPGSCSDVNVAWFAVTDQGGSGLRGYRVYRNGQFVREVSSTSMTDSGLAGSTAYSYTVEAVDNAGNRSAPAGPVGATTPTCPAQPQDWARSISGAGGEAAQAVAVDSAGNILLAGYFSGTTDFGGGSVASTATHALFLAKYRPDGSHIWSQRFTIIGSGDGLYVKGVKIDANQNILMAGTFSGTANLGPTPLVSTGDKDVFIAKFDSSGRHVWSHNFGGTKADILDALAVDAAGNAVIGGWFMEKANFGGDYLGAAYSGMHAFLAKYDPNGGHVWSRDFVCGADHRVMSAAIDSEGNVLITGYFNGAINFGGGDISAIGWADAFVAKFSPSGGHIWSQGMGGSYGDQGVTIAVDSRNNVLVTGSFFLSASFGVGAPVLSSSGVNVFIAKYTPAGNYLWSKSFGGLADDFPYSITTDSAQNVVVVGIFRSPANFGGPQLAVRGGTDVFIAKYNASGDHVWSESAASVGTDYGLSVATDGSNNVIVSGQFEGGPMTIGSRTLQNAGGYDGFLYRRAP